MDWALRYDPGQVRASCSICGCSRRFPDNLTFCVDKLFRCERCMEITAMERDQQILAFRMRPDEPEVRVGLTPQGDVASTFLQDSIDARAQAIPGWTPSATLNDAFTVVPGGVGSAWSTVLTGTGAVSLPSSGTARLSGGTGTALIYASGTAVPSFAAGRFYCRFKFTPTPSSSSTVILGAQATSLGIPAGIPFATISALLSTKRLRAVCSGMTTHTFASEIGTATSHVGVLWWNGDGHIHASVNDEFEIVRGTNSTMTAAVPFVGVGVNSVVDVTNFVAFT